MSGPASAGADHPNGSDDDDDPWGVPIKDFGGGSGAAGGMGSDLSGAAGGRSIASLGDPVQDGSSSGGASRVPSGGRGATSGDTGSDGGVDGGPGGGTAGTSDSGGG